MADPSGSASAEYAHRHEPAPLGSPRLHFRSTDSTNERARRLAIAGAPHGTLVTADEQTAGRGRHGRGWVAAPGTSLLCSLVLRWPESSQPPALLPLMAGVAAGEAIGEQALLKWPNDVVVGEELRKLAGILVEARTQDGWAVLGIGVNVAVDLCDLPAEVRVRAATLGREADAIEPLLADLLAALGAGLSRRPEETLAAWRSRDALTGRQIAWGQDQRGQAQGVDDQGRLLVQSADGSTATLSAGDVHLSMTG
ncbi:MAG: biotin--[acetyl-CoA-carboxylase] ligase [Solirubrobacteraceae bacterium]